jgi:hypothetical protein
LVVEDSFGELGASVVDVVPAGVRDNARELQSGVAPPEGVPVAVPVMGELGILMIAIKCGVRRMNSRWSAGYL